MQTDFREVPVLLDDTPIEEFMEQHLEVREESEGVWVIWSKTGKCVMKIPKANNVKLANIDSYGDEGTARRAAWRLASLLVEGVL